MLSHVADDLQHAADTRALLVQCRNSFGRLFHLGGQLADLTDRLLHHLITLLRLVVGHAGGQRCLLGVLRHFLHGGGHLVHGGCGLLGFYFLAKHAGTGLCRNRRKLLGGGGNLAHATTNTPNQATQADTHHLHGGHQLTGLITSIFGQVMAQVAGGNTLGKQHGLLQRRDNQTGNNQRRQHAQDHRSNAHGTEHH